MISSCLRENGYLLFIHPAGWRKPCSIRSKYKDLFSLMTHNNQMIYLEIHNTKDGMKVFNCGTRYDWYLVQRNECLKPTTIRDEKGEISMIDMRNWKWLPNYNMLNIQLLLAKDKEQTCDILYNSSMYEARRKHVQSVKTDEFKYPLIHSTPHKGVRYMYTSQNNLGHFRITKLIFGETGIYDSIIDIEGEYGMTNSAMAIVDTIENLLLIKPVIESAWFKDILRACSWSNFRIDWRLFVFFKKDFWKEKI